MQRSEKGMALLVVLMAIAFLLPLVFSGLEMGRFHLRRVQNELYLQEARRSAESGLSQVKEVLRQDGLADGAVDHLGDPWAMEIPALEIPAYLEESPAQNRSLHMVVEDSARYLNINALVRADGSVDAVLREVMERRLRENGLAESLVESLIDWLDADDIPTGLGGAERDWYQAEGRVYRPENGPMQSLDTLVLLRGWENVPLPLLRPIVRAVDPRCGFSGINVNTASPEVLRLLEAGVLVEPLLELRQEKPITDVAQLVAAGVVINQTISPLLRVKSDCFEVQIRAQVGHVRGLLQAWLYRVGGKVNVMRMVWGG